MRGRSVVMVVGLILACAAIPAAAAAPEKILLRAGRLLDRSVRDNVDILVEGNRIVQVGTIRSVPSGAREIDLRRRTVLPGLIDSHTHICLTPDYTRRNPVLTKTAAQRALEGMRAAHDDLMAGFTTLRDLDNEGADMSDVAVRDAIKSGLFPGPRLFVSGWALSITGGHMNLTGLAPEIDRRLPQLAIMVTGPESMLAAIRDQVKAGVDFIKIYATGTLSHVDPETLDTLAQFSEEEIRVMVREAARWGKDVAAHAYGGPGARNAAAAGVRSIEHGMMLDDATLDLMASSGTWWSPTMTVYLPGEDASETERAFRNRIVERHRDTFTRAMRRGVRIAFGTDIGAVPHGEGWRELERMGEYGMSPLEVIRSATVSGAELLRRGKDLGRIAPGYLADIIAVDGAPDRDLKALRRVPFVMANGSVVKDD
ncbi:MAG: amidohydrolase family protein [Candidatus Polarisedimenticolia bacterium]